MGLASSLATQLARRVGGAISSRIGGRAGRVAAGVGTVAAGSAIGSIIGGGFTDVGPARKKRKGLSGRDIQGAQRVMQLVSSFGYKPKLPCRRKARACGKKGY